jgi:pimeloyl-ACP methyl ester carboxylesterase
LASPNVTLTTHAEDVAGLIRAEELTDVVLVGHSYGGMVISLAVEKIPAGTVSSIVFLDAFLPEDGKSLFDYNTAEGREGGPMVEEGARTGLVSPIPGAFFGVNEDDCAWVDAQCTPQPVGTFTEKVKLTGAREAIPRKTYIYATGWAPAFAEFAARVKDDAGWRYFETSVGHDVMLDAPDWLVETLEGA